MADNRFVIQCVIGNTVKVIAVVTGIAPHCVCVLCVQVFHSLFWPLEFTLPNRDNNKCYAKIICNKLDNVRLLLLKHCCIISEPLATSAIYPYVTWMMTLFCSCLTVGSSHWFPLSGSKCWRGDAGIRGSYEMWGNQGAAGWHDWHPPNLCWGKKAILLDAIGCMLTASLVLNIMVVMWEVPCAGRW